MYAYIQLTSDTTSWWTSKWVVLIILDCLNSLETVTSTVMKVLVLFWWKDASVCHTEDCLGLVLTFCLYIFPESYHQDSLGKDVIFFFSCGIIHRDILSEIPYFFLCLRNHFIPFLYLWVNLKNVKVWIPALSVIHYYLILWAFISYT